MLAVGRRARACVSGTINYFTAIKTSNEDRQYQIQERAQERADQIQERTLSIIHRTYLENGLYLIESALSEYGTSMSICLIDIRREVSRLHSLNISKENILKRLEPILIEMRRREDISNLINRDYGSASKAFPRLLRFNITFYNALKNTFYQYSRSVEDQTDIDVMKMQLEDIELALGEKSGFIAIITILQDSQVYLETRIRQLDEYIWYKNIQTFEDFLNINDDPLYQNFISEITEYSVLLKAYSLSQGGPSEETRNASLAFNKWLTDHIDIVHFIE